VGFKYSCMWKHLKGSRCTTSKPPGNRKSLRALMSDQDYKRPRPVIRYDILGQSFSNAKELETTDQYEFLNLYRGRNSTSFQRMYRLKAQGRTSKIWYRICWRVGTPTECRVSAMSLQWP